MAGFGVPEADIAGVIGVSPKTLRKHYRPELAHGHVKANTRVAENLYRKATGDGREAVIAAIFWLKTRAGWCEQNTVSINATVSAELPLLSGEEWERRACAPHKPNGGAAGVNTLLLAATSPLSSEQN